MSPELRDFADVHQRFHEELLTLATVSAKSKADANDIEDVEMGGDRILPAVLPSVEEGVGAVQRMIGVLERLAEGGGV